MKPVGEPDALIGHVRFDERGWETERCQMAQATALILDSTSCRHSPNMSAVEGRPAVPSRCRDFSVWTHTGPKPVSSRSLFLIALSPKGSIVAADLVLRQVTVIVTNSSLPVRRTEPCWLRHCRHSRCRLDGESVIAAAAHRT